MAEFLLLSGTGEGLGLALKLKQEGHRVSTWVREGGAKRNFEGLLHSTSHWEKSLTRGTVVLFDSIGGGKTADRLRVEGYRVIGAGLFSDQVEFDWEITRELLREVDIRLASNPVPPLFSVEGWFDGTRFLSPTLYSLRRTRLCNSDLGPRTDGMGTCLWAEEGVHGYLRCLEQKLRYFDYLGPVSLTLDSQGTVVDWVCRFTFDSLPCWMRLWEGQGFSQLFLQNWTELPFRLDQFVSAVRLVQPGYGITKRVKSGVEIELPWEAYLYDVGTSEEGDFYSTGYRGLLCSVLETGATPFEATEQALEILRRSSFPDKLYRTDLSFEFQSDYETLFQKGGIQ